MAQRIRISIARAFAARGVTATGGTFGDRERPSGGRAVAIPSSGVRARWIEALLLLVLPALLCPPCPVSAQGNEGAPLLSRDYVRKLRQNLKGVNAQEIIGQYEMTGAVPETILAVQRAHTLGGIAGEANLALLGSSSVKPGLITKATYQKRDYLRFSAQLLFGDTGEGPQVDDISANLFIPEASRYAFNVLGLWKPKSRGKVSKEFAVNLGFYYAVKDLPTDSLGTQPTGVIHGHAGLEYIIVRDQLSIYANVHLLSDQQNVAHYHDFFGSDAQRTFWYAGPGFRAKFSDTLFIDLELLILTDDIQALRGTDDGILPLFRIGFSQTLTDLAGN